MSESSSSSSKGKEPVQEEEVPEGHCLSKCQHFKDIVVHVTHIAKIFAEIQKDYEHDDKCCRLFKNTANNLERMRVQFAKFK